MRVEIESNRMRVCVCVYVCVCVRLVEFRNTMAKNKVCRKTKTNKHTKGRGVNKTYNFFESTYYSFE